MGNRHQTNLRTIRTRWIKQATTNPFFKNNVAERVVWTKGAGGVTGGGWGPSPPPPPPKPGLLLLSARPWEPPGHLLNLGVFSTLP